MQRNIVSRMLILALSIHMSCRSDPGETPSSPLKECRVLISEMNFFAEPSTESFVELVMIYEKKPSFYPAVKMAKFALLFIQGNGYLVAACRFPETSVFNPSGYYVIGHPDAEYAKGNARLVDFDFKNCQLDRHFRTFPKGLDLPMVVALVYNRNKAPLNELRLNMAEGNFYEKRLLAQGHLVKIRDYLQDMYIYGSSTPASTCTIFHQIYDGYLAKETAILRDWKLGAGIIDKSLSRCGESRLPFEIDLMKYCEPSPGKENICINCVSFFAENVLPQKDVPAALNPSDEVDNLCFVESDSESVDSEGQIIDVDTFALSIQHLDSDNDIDREAEATRDLQRQYCPLSDGGGLHVWEDCTSLPSAMLKDIRKETYFDTDLITKKEVCYWFEIIRYSRAVRCKLCDHIINVEQLVHDRPGSKLLNRILRPGGYMPRSEQKRKLIGEAIEHHLTNPIHLISVDYFKLKDKRLAEKEFDEQFKRIGGPYHEYILQTKNMIFATFQAVKMSISFYNFNLYAEIIQFLGGKIGHVYKNRFGMRLMAMHISKEMHKELVEHLLVSKMPVSIIVDTSSDIQHQNILAIILQTFDNHKRVSEYFYKSVHLAQGESGKEIFTRFMNIVRDDGMENYFREFLIGMTSDGAASMSSTFRRELEQFASQKLIWNHCQAHVLQLVIFHAYKPFKSIMNIDKIVNDLYRFLTRSSKNKIVLRNMQAEVESNSQRQFELKRIFKIRWIGSNNRATKTILHNWKTIVSTLQSIWTDKGNDRDTRYTAPVLSDWLQDNTFLAHMCFISDVSDALTELSLTLQTRNTTIMGKRFLRENTIAKLRNLITTNGKNTINILQEAETKIPNFDLFQSANPVKDFELNDVVVQGIPLTQTYRSKDTVYLYENRQKYINGIITEFENYFAPDTTDSFDIFHASIFKDVLTNPELGKSDIKIINRMMQTTESDRTLYKNWKLLVTAIVQDAQFESKKHLPPEKFWQHYLEYPDGELGWTPSIRGVISKILSIAATSSSVERVFSFYTKEKSYRRYSLLPSTVDALIRIKFNGVSQLNQLRAEKYAWEFIKRHSRADDTSRRGTKIEMKSIDGNLFSDIKERSSEDYNDDIDER